MPKSKAGDVYLFKTEGVYKLLGQEPFGTLLSEEQIKALPKEELYDYVEYKIRVSRGLNRD